MPPPTDPTYDQFVKVEAPQTAATYAVAYKDKPPPENQRPTPGDMNHVAWRRLHEGWTQTAILRDIYVGAGVTPPQPTPGPIPPVQPPSAGRLGDPRGNRFQYLDDTGGWLLLGTSWFWGAHADQFEPDRADAHLDYFRREGLHDARVFACGLKKGDLERSLNPAKPEFQKGVAGITDRAIRFGRRIDWTIFGAVYPAPTKEKRRQVVKDFCAALKGRTVGVTGIEIANEGDSNGFGGDAGRDELKDLVALVHDLLPEVLVAPTCPARKDDITDAMVAYYYLNTDASVVYEHHARKVAAPDGIWRPTKKPWRETNFSTPGCPLLRRNREPRGNTSSGSWTDDPLVLAMDMIVTYVSGEGGYTWHTGPGIYGVAYDSPYGHRAANVWENKNAAAITGAFRNAIAALPADLPNWTKHKTNEGPFRFVDTPDEQLSAAYSASSGAGVGQRIIQPVWGVVQNTEFKLPSAQQCDGETLNPVTGETTHFDRAFTVTKAQRATLAVATRTS